MLILEYPNLMIIKSAYKVTTNSYIIQFTSISPCGNYHKQKSIETYSVVKRAMACSNGFLCFGTTLRIQLCT